MQKRNSVLHLSLRALLAAIAGFAVVVAGWNLLGMIVNQAAPSDWERYKDLLEITDAVAMLFCFGVITGAASSAVRIMQPVAGKTGTVAACVGVLPALALCVADSLQPAHLLCVMIWRWHIAVAVVALCGVLFGMLLAGQRRGIKALWLPAVMLSSAAVVLWAVYIPTVRFLMDLFVAWQ